MNETTVTYFKVNFDICFDNMLCTFPLCFTKLSSIIGSFLLIICEKKTINMVPRMIFWREILELLQNIYIYLYIKIYMDFISYINHMCINTSLNASFTQHSFAL